MNTFRLNFENATARKKNNAHFRKLNNLVWDKSDKNL